MFCLDSHIPSCLVKRQLSSWECGYITCHVAKVSAEILNDVVVTVSDRDDKFRSFADRFSYGMAAVTKMKKTLLTEAKCRAKQHAAVAHSPARAKKYLGRAAATPDRKQKKKELEEIGIHSRAKGSTRRMNTSPKTAAQCKDGKTREKIGSFLKALQILWKMTEMYPSEGQPRIRLGVVAYDEILGNSERRSHDDTGNKRAIPKLSFLFSDDDAIALVLDTIDRRGDNEVEFVKTSSTKQFLYELHGQKLGMKAKRTHEELVHAQGNIRIKEDMLKPDVPRTPESEILEYVSD